MGGRVFFKIKTGKSSVDKMNRSKKRKFKQVFKRLFRSDVERRLLGELVKKNEERGEALVREREQLVREWVKANKVGGVVEEEGKDYILKLPDEVLEVIISKVKEPKDLHNLYWTCTRFRGILEPTKVDWYFPQILPHLMQHLKVKQFLKCRRVCKSWRDSVDTVIDEKLYPVHTPVSSFPSFHHLPGKYYGKIDRLCNLEKIYELADTNSYNLPKNASIIGREISVMDPIPPWRYHRLYYDSDEENVPDPVAYWNKIWLVLDEYGRAIWECKFVITEEDIDYDAPHDGHLGVLYERIQNCLSRLPNLKKLTLSLEAEADAIGPYEYRLDTINRCKKQVKPFPSVPNLIELSLKKPLSWFHHLFPAYLWQQLQKITLERWDLQQILTATNGILFPNLKTLELTNCNQKEDLEPLELLRCPLEKLTIQITDTQVDIPCCFPAVNHFGSTLQHLEFKWYGFMRPHPITLSAQYLESCLQLYAPGLKALTLQNPPERCCNFTFLLSLPSLEYISIFKTSWDNTPPYFMFEKADEMVEIQGFINKMYNSNIWEKLPLLKEFRYREYVLTTLDYTRDGYNNFVEEEIGNIK